MFALIALVGCAEAPLGLSAECSRTSQCDQPLVCRLQACRSECASSRDCPLGSLCLADEAGFGSCRLPTEASCSSAEDCPRPTTCIANQCVNGCVEDDDCTPGTSCIEGGCRVVDLPCADDRDCIEGVCIRGVCADECRSERDCRFGGSCVSGVCIGSDSGPRPDVPGVDVGIDAGVSALEGVTAVAAGERYSCAVAEGRVHCWGALPPASAPIDNGVCSAIFTGADDIAAAADHYCAREGSTLRCAGANGSGRLGDGTTVDSSAFVDVLLSDVGVFGVGGGDTVGGRLAHSCAVSDGEVYCWGGNFSFQLGDGTTTSSPTPVATGVTDAVDVATGYGGSCAVNVAGELWCWGAGVPLAPVTGIPTPTLVALPARASRVDMAAGISGGFEGCVIDEMSRLHCWMMGGAPTTIMGVSATRVGVGGGNGFVCAVQTDSSVTCWGWNRDGEGGAGLLGDTIPAGTQLVTDGTMPLMGAVDVAAGERHACAIVGTDVYCWGTNDYGQLGSNGRTPSNVARRVTCVR